MFATQPIAEAEYAMPKERRAIHSAEMINVYVSPSAPICLGFRRRAEKSSENGAATHMKVGEDMKSNRTASSSSTTGSSAFPAADAAFSSSNGAFLTSSSLAVEGAAPLRALHRTSSPNQ